MFHTLVLEYGSTSSKFPFAARSPQAPPYNISCSKFIIQTGIEDNQMRVITVKRSEAAPEDLDHCLPDTVSAVILT